MLRTIRYGGLIKVTQLYVQFLAVWFYNCLAVDILYNIVHSKRGRVWFFWIENSSVSGIVSVFICCAFFIYKEFLQPRILQKWISQQDNLVRSGRETFTGYQDMYPGQRFFALPYRKLHFLSSICSEGIQCWSSCRGFIVLQAMGGRPLLPVQAIHQHFIIQCLPVCVVKMGKAVRSALLVPQRLSCQCDLHMCVNNIQI